MTRISITCESCGHAWSIVGTLTIYERQALESRPCPVCGAYTLCGQEASVERPVPLEFISPAEKLPKVG